MVRMAKSLMVPFTAALAIVLLGHAPVLAITPELAKKCRQMAVNKHPIPRPDKKPEAVKARHQAALAHHQFYRECVAKDGKV